MTHDAMRIRRWALFSALLLTGFVNAARVSASNLVAQTPLDGNQLYDSIKFDATLPVFGPGYNATLPRVDALKHPLLEVTMKEVEQQVLPVSDYDPTRVWAYEVRDAITKKLLGPAHWPAVTIEAQRFIPTIVKYVNELPSFGQSIPIGTGLVQGLITVDQSIHWANPLGNTGMMNCMDITMPNMWNPECSNPYTGPIPAVPHLHGGETRSAFDGGPEQWFTPNGINGKDYATLDSPGPGKAIYLYDNLQEPGTLWFHDHALGATRTNVYGGLAAFYFINAPLTEPRNLPGGAYDIELAIQDRQFDTNGQLFFPDGSNPDFGELNGPPPNPDMHPFWNPEYIGDVAIVNGAPWPHLDVEPRRYLFRLLDGSNARFYNLTFGDSGEPSPPVYVVGRDDAYLDSPAPVSSVLFAPGERVYVIVDFSKVPMGSTVTVKNDAQIPFPEGLIPGADQPGMASIMRFNVNIPLKDRRDTSCNPASGGCGRPLIARTERLTDGFGHLGKGVKIDKVRQLVLKEVMGMDAQGEETGPLEVLVNNTKWDGLHSPSIAAEFADGVSELPQVGSTEMWEIINLTGDAHPMHTHLVQFQILNRQPYNADAYIEDWEAAFPGSATLGCPAGVFCPGYGPPGSYSTPNGDGALGGNLALRNNSGINYLIDPLTNAEYPARPPAAEESGWNDTAILMPGEVMRIVARWAPTSIPNRLVKPGRNTYSFDPTEGPGYVWHCHIIDHEDNEMMRPYKVVH